MIFLVKSLELNLKTLHISSEKDYGSPVDCPSQPWWHLETTKRCRQIRSAPDLPGRMIRQEGRRYTECLFSLCGW